MTTYATWDSNNMAAGLTLSNNDKTFSGAYGWKNAKANMGKNSGKWYYEISIDAADTMVALCDYDFDNTGNLGTLADSWSLYVYGVGYNRAYSEGGFISNYLPTMLPPVIVGVAVDMDNLKAWWRGPSGYRAGCDPETGANPSATINSGIDIYPAAGCRAATYDITINPGDSAFSYAVPAGFNAGWYEGGAAQTALEDISLFLAAYSNAAVDLSTLLEAAYLLGLVDLPIGLHALGHAFADLPLPLQAAAVGLGDMPLGLSALAHYRQDIALALAAVSPEVLRSLGLSLSATDGTMRQDLAMALSAIQKAPAFKAVMAQRLASIKRGAV